MDSGWRTTGGGGPSRPFWRTLEESCKGPGLGLVSLEINTQHTRTHQLTLFGLAQGQLLVGVCSFLGLFCAVSSSPHDFFFTASDDLLTCSKNVAVKVSFVFVVWKEPCK